MQHLVSSLPISNVQDAYRDVPPSALSYNFITLMQIMELITKNSGGNNFRIPHKQKEMRKRAGENLSVLQCDQSAVEQVRNMVDKTVV